MSLKHPRALAAAAVVALCLAVPAAASALNVFADSSLRDVFPQIDSGQTYRFGASNMLQLQIERGADADVFAPASPAEAQALFKEGKCNRPVTFATNKLVLIVPKGNPGSIRSVYSLRTGHHTIVVGRKGEPIGVYTRALLRRLGLSRVLARNTVIGAKDAADVVSKVVLRSADVGFAYFTDGKIASDQVETIPLPRYAQPPVRYQICSTSRSVASTGFITKLRSSAGRDLLTAAGFGVPPTG